MNPTLPLISVIIPTYRDWHRLQICLDALSAQNFDPSQYEIIIINNLPQDSPPLNLETPLNAKILVEKKPGSYAARNTGAKYAKGSILAFTDSDCIPHKNWLSSIAKFISMNQQLMSGKVEMFSTSNNKQLNVCESYDYIFGINQDLYEHQGTAATANLAVTKSLFFKNNGFNEKFMSGGDADFCLRSRKQFNQPVIYNEKAVVLHPLRSDLKKMSVKVRRVIGGRYAQGKFRTILATLSPPLVRLNTLFFKKQAPIDIKFKALLALFYFKLVQIITVLKILTGAPLERE